MQTTVSLLFFFLIWWLSDQKGQHVIFGGRSKGRTEHCASICGLLKRLLGAVWLLARSSWNPVLASYSLQLAGMALVLQTTAPMDRTPDPYKSNGVSPKWIMSPTVAGGNLILIKMVSYHPTTYQWELGPCLKSMTINAWKWRGKKGVILHPLDHSLCRIP